MSYQFQFVFGTNSKMCSSKLIHIFKNFFRFYSTRLFFINFPCTSHLFSWLTVAPLFALFICALPSPFRFRFRFHFCLLLLKITLLHSFYFRTHFRFPSYLGLALVSWRNFWQPTINIHMHIHHIYLNIFIIYIHIYE